MQVGACREVIALEERLLHLLHNVSQVPCEWVVKSRDPQKFQAEADGLAAAEAALAEAEERWLELEMLREELEGARDCG